MQFTLSLDDKLIKKVRKIAVEDAASGQRRREREALERSFERFRFKGGGRTWKRADLHERS